MNASRVLSFDVHTGWVDYQDDALQRTSSLLVDSGSHDYCSKVEDYKTILADKINKVKASRLRVNSIDRTSKGILKLIAALLDSHSPKAYELALRIYRQQPKQFSSYFSFLNIKGLTFVAFPSLSCLPLQQLYIKSDNPKNILLCFTGRTGRLNMPLPIFHGLVSNLYDGVAYFYDPFNDNYTFIRETIGRSCDKLIKTWPQSRFSVVCTSTGGIMAHSLPRQFDAVKKLCSSPVLGKCNEIVEKLNQCETERFRHSRFFFSLGPSHYHASTDRESYLLLLKGLSAELFSTNVYNLGFYSQSHATLMSLALMNRAVFDLQFKWLTSD